MSYRSPKSDGRSRRYTRPTVSGKQAGQRNQQTFNGDSAVNSCRIGPLPASNERTKRVDANRAIIYPKQPETHTVASFLIVHSM